MKPLSELSARKHLIDAWPGEVTRIEPGGGSDFGVPDVHLVGPQFPIGWAEFKFISDPEKLVEIRAGQRLWWIKNLRWTNRIALVVCLPDAFVVLPVGPIARSPYLPVGYPLGGGTRYPYASAKALPAILVAAYGLN